MDNRIRKAFEQVRASEDRKDRTRAFLAEKTRGYARRPRAASYPRRLAAACLALLLSGSYWFCLAPAAEISIDVNPSVELAVNRLDQVVSVRGRNDDGRQLADTLDLRFTNYAKAVEAVLESPQVAALTAEGETVAITVVGRNEKRLAQMLSQVESCTAQRKNLYCCSARPQEVSEAHKAGLSCGKYGAFLELQRLDPDITVEEVREMTMGELLRRIQNQTGEGRGHHRRQHGRS